MWAGELERCASFLFDSVDHVPSHFCRFFMTFCRLVRTQGVPHCIRPPCSGAERVAKVMWNQQLTLSLRPCSKIRTGSGNSWPRVRGDVRNGFAWGHVRGGNNLDIQRVLTQLRRERRILDHAIAALEALQRTPPKRRISAPKSTLSGKVTKRGKRKASLASERGPQTNLINFPPLRRSGS
jgi:hypothetical protein